MHACIWLNMWGPLPCYKCYESTLIALQNAHNFDNNIIVINKRFGGWT